jgi:hypothetical protein
MHTQLQYKPIHALIRRHLPNTWAQADKVEVVRCCECQLLVKAASKVWMYGCLYVLTPPSLCLYTKPNYETLLYTIHIYIQGGVCGCRHAGSEGGSGAEAAPGVDDHTRLCLCYHCL